MLFHSTKTFLHHPSSYHVEFSSRSEATFDVQGRNFEEAPPAWSARDHCRCRDARGDCYTHVSKIFVRRTLFNPSRSHLVARFMSEQSMDLNLLALTNYFVATAILSGPNRPWYEDFSDSRQLGTEDSRGTPAGNEGSSPHSRCVLICQPFEAWWYRSWPRRIDA